MLFIGNLASKTILKSHISGFEIVKIVKFINFMPILPFIFKFLSYFWSNFQNVKSTTELQNSQIVKLLAQKTFLEIILVVQTLGIAFILLALTCFVRMSRANFYWFGVLFFWGIPALFQFSLILRDFFWIKLDFFDNSAVNNFASFNLEQKPGGGFQSNLQNNLKTNFSRILQDNLALKNLIKKYFVLVILINFGLYFVFWLPILRAIFGMPFENGSFGKLGGNGEIFSFLALIWPYFVYLSLCGIEYWQIRKLLFKTGKTGKSQTIEINVDNNSQNTKPNLR